MGSEPRLSDIVDPMPPGSALRALPRVATMPEAWYHPGAMGATSLAFASRMGLSQVSRWSLEFASPGAESGLSVRPPIDYWPWADAESPDEQAGVMRNAQTQRRSPSGSTPVAAVNASPVIHRGLPRTLIRRGGTDGPGAFAAILRPEMVDPSDLGGAASSSSRGSAKQSESGLLAFKRMLEQTGRLEPSSTTGEVPPASLARPGGAVEARRSTTQAPMRVRSSQPPPQTTGRGGPADIEEAPLGRPGLPNDAIARRSTRPGALPGADFATAQSVRRPPDREATTSRGQDRPSPPTSRGEDREWTPTGRGEDREWTPTGRGDDRVSAPMARHEFESPIARRSTESSRRRSTAGLLDSVSSPVIDPPSGSVPDGSSSSANGGRGVDSLDVAPHAVLVRGAQHDTAGATSADPASVARAATARSAQAEPDRPVPAQESMQAQRQPDRRAAAAAALTAAQSRSMAGGVVQESWRPTSAADSAAVAPGPRPGPTPTSTRSPAASPDPGRSTAASPAPARSPAASPDPGRSAAASPAPARSPDPGGVHQQQGTPASRPAVSPVAPAQAFTEVLRAAPSIAPRPLPESLRPLAAAIVGRTAVSMRTDHVARRALAAAGKRAATTGSVIHLHREPDTHADRALIAHELTHVAHLSPLPRFFDDDRPSAEERRADDIARLVRRSPILTRELHRSTDRDDQVARRSISGSQSIRSTRSEPTSSGATIQRSTRPLSPVAGGTITAADLVARVADATRTVGSDAAPASIGRSTTNARAVRPRPAVAPAVVIRRSMSPTTDLGRSWDADAAARASTTATNSVRATAKSDTIRRTVSPGASATRTAPLMAQRLLESGGTQSADLGNSPATSQSSNGSDTDPLTQNIADLRDASGAVDFVDWIMDQIEDRLLSEMQRRGGRFRGEF